MTDMTDSPTNIDRALAIAPRIRDLQLVQQELKRAIITALDGSVEAALNHPLFLETERELIRLREELTILI